MPLTKKTDEFTVKEDTEKFLRRVKLKAHFHDKEQPSDEPQRDEFESLKPKKSNWTPPDGQFTSVDLFITNYLNTDLPTIPQSAPTKG